MIVCVLGSLGTFLCIPARGGQAGPPAWVGHGAGAFQKSGRRVFSGVGVARGFSDRARACSLAKLQGRVQIQTVASFFRRALRRTAFDSFPSLMSRPENYSAFMRWADNLILDPYRSDRHGARLAEFWVDPKDGACHALVQLDMDSYVDPLLAAAGLPQEVTRHLRDHASEVFGEFAAMDAPPGMLRGSGAYLQDGKRVLAWGFDLGIDVRSMDEQGLPEVTDRTRRHVATELTRLLEEYGKLLWTAHAESLAGAGLLAPANKAVFLRVFQRVQWDQTETEWANPLDLEGSSFLLVQGDMDSFLGALRDSSELDAKMRAFIREEGGGIFDRWAASVVTSDHPSRGVPPRIVPIAASPTMPAPGETVTISCALDGPFLEATSLVLRWTVNNGERPPDRLWPKGVQPGTDIPMRQIAPGVLSAELPTDSAITRLRAWCVDPKPPWTYASLSLVFRDPDVPAGPFDLSSCKPDVKIETIKEDAEKEGGRIDPWLKPAFEGPVSFDRKSESQSLVMRWRSGDWTQVEVEDHLRKLQGAWECMEAYLKWGIRNKPVIFIKKRPLKHNPSFDGDAQSGSGHVRIQGTSLNLEIAIHELTHVLKNSPESEFGSMPLAEGLAVFMSRLYGSGERPRSGDYIHPKTLRLMTVTRQNACGKRHYDSFGLFVRYLVQRFGIDRFLRVLGGSPFESVYGKSDVDLQTEFADYGMEHDSRHLAPSLYRMTAVSSAAQAPIPPARPR